MIICENLHMEDTVTSIVDNSTVFASIIDNLKSGVAVYKATDDGQNFSFIDLNKAGEESSKVKIEEIRGKLITDVFPSVVEMGLLDTMIEVNKTGKPIRHPTTVYQDERITTWVENYIYKIPTQEIIAVYDDLTEQKTQEQELNLIKERYELAMRGSSDGLWDWDITNNNVYFSDRWKSMLGYDPEELENNFDTWKELLHPDDKERCTNYVQDYVKSDGKSSFEMEFRMRHKNGSWVHILGRALMVVNDDGKPTRMVGTHVDITQRVQYETQLKEKLNEIETLNKIMIGRETKMVELKKEIEKLKQEIVTKS